MSQYLNENESSGGTIGTLGNIAFETSSNKIRTFDNFKLKNSARFATHDIMNQKPVTEYIGLGLDSISFSMRFDIMLGVSPADEIKALRAIRDKGEAVELVIGGQPVNENLWVILDISEDWNKIDNRGSIIIASVNVTLQEYVRDPYGTTVGGTSSGS